MIRNESEYRQALLRFEQETKRLTEHRSRLKKTGLTASELKRALDPLRSFNLQLSEELQAYRKLAKGEVPPILNLHGLGRSLVLLRLARGVSQRELARRLGVHESQVSRDERNDYHGIAVERAQRILDALSVEMTSDFELGER